MNLPPAVAAKCLELAGVAPAHRFTSEAAFMAAVIGAAQARGWLVAHFRAVRVARLNGGHYFETPVQADGKGFPDLVLVRRGRLLVAELKVGDNRPTAAQGKWIEAFREAEVSAHVWTPDDWSDIQDTLM